MFPFRLLALALVFALFATSSFAAAPTNVGNRLTYLDSDGPFYPHRDFPKLITPQWVGKPGVEAVVILAIDDMRDSRRYETFLRPILERLKKMDGRAPVSIFANVATNGDPQLAAWIKEGLSIEVHTLAHPCPLLQRGSFTNAANTYHGGVDLIASVTGVKPVAFRMPCCDSMNSPSPRFYSEIFSRTSPAGNFLTMDSSVMCLLTTNDPALPRELVLDAQGRERFRKYFPAQTNAVTKKSLANFGTWIEDYPYPYVINKLCWEFPAMVPSDWEAFNLHGATNATTLADWKAALDAVVLKQGVFTWIFHPHGWSSPAQIIEFIDHAERKHGKKVKFLTFREAQEKLDRNLLKGQPLRDGGGGDNGVRLLDVDNDGVMDVIIGNRDSKLTRVWRSGDRSWLETSFPARLNIVQFPMNPDWQAHVVDARVRFGVLRADGLPTVVVPEQGSLPVTAPMATWEFIGWQWMRSPERLGGLTVEVRLAMLANTPGMKPEEIRDFSFLRMIGMFAPDRGVRFRDMDHDGICELIVANESQQAIFQWSEKDKAWWKLSAGWPTGVSIVRSDDWESWRDNGVRFADVNGDGFEDLLVSNEKGFSLHLYINTPRGNLGWAKGWTYKQREGKRAGAEVGRGVPTAPPDGSQRTASPTRDIPPFVREGPYRNNGAWFHRGQLFVQNEDTAHLPDNVIRIPFRDLLTGDEPPPKSPEEALAAFSVRPGFKVELVASEPLVMDPVAFDWGADGRLWVVEMADYPSGVPLKPLASSPPINQPSAEHPSPALRAPSPLLGGGERDGVRGGGRVVFLEDTDGDGRYDKRTVFLDGLNFPNGVMPWRKGVLISAAPDIFYAEDTDGDGKADLKKVLFTGFREGNQQHRINGFDYGLDGWVYAANGDSGGVIQRVGGVLTASGSSPSPLGGERVGVRGEAKPAAGATPRPQSLSTQRGEGSQVVDIRGHDIRFKPDTGELELVAGQTQFGRHRDDWGNWFGNNNPNWLWHYHIPIHYLKRNPQLVVKSTRTMLANYSPPNQVFTIGARQQRFNWPTRINEVTSANSATPYRDDLFGPDFATSVFISEPANNVVHREVLEPDGVTFRSRRAPDEQDREFLASSDNWFRPTMLKNGPDGALYIADMYRLIIEHPEYFPDELKNRPDMRDGDDKGRIWRVVPEGAKLRKVPNLAKLSTAELVAAMDSPNGWQRDTVMRLLFERQDKQALSHLVEMVTSHGISKARNPKVRVQALCCLGVLNGLTLGIITAGARDWHPSVREHAARLSEGFATELEQAFRLASVGPQGSDEQPRLMAGALTNLGHDDSVRVRYQLAFSAGAWNRATASLVLSGLARRDAENSDVRTAILTSLPRAGADMLVHLVMSLDETAQMVESISSTLAAPGNERQLSLALDAISQNRTNAIRGIRERKIVPVMIGILDALDRRSMSFNDLKATADTGLRQSLQRFEYLFTQARADATLQSAIRNPQSAIAATRLLARGPTEQDADLDRLVALLHPASPPEVQKASMDSIKKLASPRVAELLLAKWNELMPAVRAEATTALLSRGEWVQLLLASIEAGKLGTSALGPAQQQQLLTHAQPAIRERASKLFTRVNPDRAKVIENFRSVETLTGNAQRGGQIFGGLCGTCHRIGGGARGGVGPDLGTVADKSVAQLLTAILDPSQAVDPAYVYYIGYTKDFRDVSGIIVAETPNSIMLRNAGGQDDTVLRANLVELKTSGLSMMPEGLEANLSPQAMADLIAFIKSGAPGGQRGR